MKRSTTELIFSGGIFLMYAVPALIGIFWGAPLVTRELEAAPSGWRGTRAFRAPAGWQRSSA